MRHAHRNHVAVRTHLRCDSKSHLLKDHRKMVCTASKFLSPKTAEAATRTEGKCQRWIHLSSSFPSKYLHGVMKARVNLKDSVFLVGWRRKERKNKMAVRSRWFCLRGWGAKSGFTEDWCAEFGVHLMDRWEFDIWVRSWSDFFYWKAKDSVHKSKPVRLCLHFLFYLFIDVLHAHTGWTVSFNNDQHILVESVYFTVHILCKRL